MVLYKSVYTFDEENKEVNLLAHKANLRKQKVIHKPFFHEYQGQNKL